MGQWPPLLSTHTKVRSGVESGRPTLRLPHREQTSRSRQSRTLVPLSLGHLGRVALGPVTACLAPHDEPDTGRSGVAERHPRARVGVDLRPAESAVRRRGPLNRSPRLSFCE